MKKKAVEDPLIEALKKTNIPPEDLPAAIHYAQSWCKTHWGETMNDAESQALCELVAVTFAKYADHRVKKSDLTRLKTEVSERAKKDSLRRLEQHGVFGGRGREHQYRDMADIYDEHETKRGLVNKILKVLLASDHELKDWEIAEAVGFTSGNRESNARELRRKLASIGQSYKKLKNEVREQKRTKKSP